MTLLPVLVVSHLFGIVIGNALSHLGGNNRPDI